MNNKEDEVTSVNRPSFLHLICKTLFSVGEMDRTRVQTLRSKGTPTSSGISYRLRGPRTLRHVESSLHKYWSESNDRYALYLSSNLEDRHRVPPRFLTFPCYTTVGTFRGPLRGSVLDIQYSRISVPKVLGKVWGLYVVVFERCHSFLRDLSFFFDPDSESERFHTGIRQWIEESRISK